MDQTPRTCNDCGATFPPPPPVGIGGPSGYAIRQNGERICYACSDRDEQAAFRVADVFVAYVSCNGESITTWPGGFLARITCMSRIRSGFGDAQYSVDAVAPDGSQWYGRNEGAGMVIRLRRKKTRRKP